MQQHFARAHEALEASEELLRDGYLRDAASRVYYAMYHAAYGRLLKHGHAPKTHRGLILLGVEPARTLIRNYS